MRPESPLYMRPVSGLLGRVLGSPITALTMMTTAPFRPGPSEDSEGIKDVLKALKNDKLLKDHVVNLNDVHPIENLGRVWTNPRTSLGTKLLGTLLSPLGDASAALSRSDHYNPWADSSTIFTNHPAILAHELGHAKDFRKEDDPGLYAFGRMAPLINFAYIPYQEYAASENAMKDLANIKTISKDTLEESGSLLSAGFGSYLGGLTEEALGARFLTLPAAWHARAFGGSKSFNAPNRNSKGD